MAGKFKAAAKKNWFAVNTTNIGSCQVAINHLSGTLVTLSQEVSLNETLSGTIVTFTQDVRSVLSGTLVTIEQLVVS